MACGLKIIRPDLSEVTYQTFSIENYDPILKSNAYSVESDDFSSKGGNTTTATALSTMNRKVQFSVSGNFTEIAAFKNDFYDVIRAQLFTIELPRIDPFNDGNFDTTHAVKMVSIGKMPRGSYFYTITFTLYKP